MKKEKPSFNKVPGASEMTPMTTNFKGTPPKAGPQVKPSQKGNKGSFTSEPKPKKKVMPQKKGCC